MNQAAIIRSLIVSLPEIIVIIGACVLLMGSLVLGKRRGPTLTLASLGILAAAATTAFMVSEMLSGHAEVAYNGMFVADNFAFYFKGVFLLATFLTILLSERYLWESGILRGEYFVILLFALAGMMVVASAVDLLAIYVGLELMALSIYVLTGFLRHDKRSNEAALKYVILGAMSSGIILYGISLIYGVTGTTQLADMAAALTADHARDPVLGLAVLFLVAGLMFKAGAVPFHMWLPDIYEGAPTTITAFMSVGPKAAVFAVILRVLPEHLGVVEEVWIPIITVIAVVTLAYGNFVALAQTKIKRLLAYSSIGHVGFVLLGVVAGGRDGLASVMLYLLIYAFMNLGAFAVVVMMRRGDAQGEDIDDLTGLAKDHRLLALLMLIFMFSLAGIPPTAGFFAKFYILVALVEQGHLALAVIAVVLSVVAAFYYIRIVMVMYMKEPSQKFDLAASPTVHLALVITGLGTIGVGLAPAWFLDWALKSVFPGMS